MVINKKITKKSQKNIDKKNKLVKILIDLVT